MVEKSDVVLDDFMYIYIHSKNCYQACVKLKCKVESNKETTVDEAVKHCPPSVDEGYLSCSHFLKALCWIPSIDFTEINKFYGFPHFQFRILEF